MHLTLNYTQAYVSVIDPMYLQSTLYIYLQHVQRREMKISLNYVFAKRIIKRIFIFINFLSSHTAMSYACIFTTVSVQFDSFFNTYRTNTSPSKTLYDMYTRITTRTYILRYILASV